MTNAARNRNAKNPFPLARFFFGGALRGEAGLASWGRADAFADSTFAGPLALWRELDLLAPLVGARKPTARCPGTAGFGLDLLEADIGKLKGSLKGTFCWRFKSQVAFEGRSHRKPKR